MLQVRNEEHPFPWLRSLPAPTGFIPLPKLGPIFVSCDQSLTNFPSFNAIWLSRKSHDNDERKEKSTKRRRGPSTCSFANDFPFRSPARFISREFCLCPRFSFDLLYFQSFLVRQMLASKFGLYFPCNSHRQIYFVVRWYRQCWNSETLKKKNSISFIISMIQDSTANLSTITSVVVHSFS